LVYIAFWKARRENISIASVVVGIMLKTNLSLFVVLLFISASLAGCTSEDAEEIQMFPQFSSVADDGETYDNERMEGNPFIVIFSAEWCNLCYDTMFSIWETEAELPVLVMSTDPAENAGGYTLSEWHDSANASDDQDDDVGITLSSYAFMKGVEAGQELGITSPGTVIFVNSEGIITNTHVGVLDDTALIAELWQEASL
jgi:hypothetical protein|tara:strand:- start:587 stop:1186 length:600 start_codon:yes stop_codon:yes gene_type:complete